MTSDITRREFLQLSLTAAGGFVTPLGLVPRPPGSVTHKGSFVALVTAAGDVCPTLVQSPWLGMAALGDNVRPYPLGGVHLRWAFHPTLGFPRGGFDLYRRPHVEAMPMLCADVDLAHMTGRFKSPLRIGEVVLASDEDIAIAGGLSLDIGRAVDLRGKQPVSIWLGEVCRRVQVEVVDLSDASRRDPGSIVATAFDGVVAVASARSDRASDLQKLDLIADRIDRVVLGGAQGLDGGPMNGGLTRVYCAPMGDDVCSFLNVDPTAGRVQLNQACRPAEGGVTCEPKSIFLPLYDKDYPGQLPSMSAEWPEARRRTPVAGWPSPGTPAGEVPQDFTDLRDTLAQLVHPPDPHTLIPAASDPPVPLCPPDSEPAARPDGFYDPLGLVLLASIDPDIARVVGLYWIDGQYFVDQQRQIPDLAKINTRYDYLVVGHYPPTAAGAAACDGWEADALGSAITGPTPHGPLIYSPPDATSLDVVSVAVPGLDATRALALRRTSGVNQGPLTIRLPRPCRAVELYVGVANGTSATARAFSNGVEVDTQTWRPPGAGCPTDPCPGILLLAAEAIDELELDVALAVGFGAGTLLLAKTCIYIDYLPGGDIGWIVHDVDLDGTPPLPAPGYLNGAPLPAASQWRVGPNQECIFQHGQMAAGLRWGRGITEGGLVPRGAVVYDLWRQTLGNGASAASINPLSWGSPAETNIIVALRDEACDAYAPPPGWPPERQDYLDAPRDPDPPAHWFAYRVLGRDIFGRESGFTVSAPIDLADTVPPPPPVAVHARYLDPDDPHLTEKEHGWTHPASGPQHQLYVEWHWPDNLKEQAPDTTEFRIYFHPGRLNAVVGAVTDVTLVSASGDIAGEELYRLTTDVVLGPPSIGDPDHAFSGEWMGQGDQLYPVVDSGTDGAFLTLTIRRLVLNLPQPTPSDLATAHRNGKASAAVDSTHALAEISPVMSRAIIAPDLQPVPRAGAFSLSVRAPQPFAGMIAVSAARGPEPIEGESTDTTIVVETDVTLSIPADSLAGLGLRLIQRGIGWDIVGNETGPHGKLKLRRRDCDPLGREPLQRDPIAGEGFVVVQPDEGRPSMQPFMLESGNLYWRDVSEPANWSRRVKVVPHVLRAPETDDKWWVTVALDPVLAIPDREGAGYGAVGVTAADSSPYGKDSWAIATSSAQRQGNEGKVGGPALVVRGDYRIPQTPARNQDVLWTTPADFLGRSFFRVRWQNLEKRVPPIPNTPSELRYLIYRALEDPQGSGPPDDEDARYVLITPEPLRPDEHGDVAEPGHPTAKGDLLQYRDTLDGKSRSRYYYRVRAVSVSGTPGDFSDPIGPVQCPDVVGPRAPVITKVVGGDREITIVWAANAGDSVTDHRIYRADNAKSAQDVRAMELMTAEPKLSDTTGEWTWTDMLVRAQLTYFYRVVAVDSAGNLSRSGPPIAASAFDITPPDPATWQQAIWVKVDQDGIEHSWSETVTLFTPAIRLDWIVVAPTIESLVQRRIGDALLWETITSWQRIDCSFRDETVSVQSDYRYRVKTRKANGHTSVSETVSILPPP